MNRVLKLSLALSLAASVAVVSAKKPAPVGGPAELSVANITVKSKGGKGNGKGKGKGNAPQTSINNVTAYILNAGGTDAKSIVSYYLSDDDILTTVSDGVTPADALVHSQATGKIKAGSVKKRTLGGGLLKQLDVQSGQTLFVVIDEDNLVEEINEADNWSGITLP